MNWLLANIENCTRARTQSVDGFISNWLSEGFCVASWRKKTGIAKESEATH